MFQRLTKRHFRYIFLRLSSFKIQGKECKGKGEPWPENESESQL